MALRTSVEIGMCPTARPIGVVFKPPQASGGHGAHPRVGRMDLHWPEPAGRTRHRPGRSCPHQPSLYSLRSMMAEK